MDTWDLTGVTNNNHSTIQMEDPNAFSYSTTNKNLRKRGNQRKDTERSQLQRLYVGVPSISP